MVYLNCPHLAVVFMLYSVIELFCTCKFITMKRKIINNEMLPSIIVILMVMTFWFGISPKLYQWYSYPGNGEWMKNLYHLLDGNYLVNFPLCFLLGYLVYKWSHRINRDRDIRYFRFALVFVVGVILISSRTGLVYAKIFESLDWFTYQVYLLLLLGFPIFIMVCKMCKRISPKSEDNTVKGFPMDSVSNDQVSNVLKEYAKHLVGKLLQTNLQEESFALGITGGWGTGKTKFLDVMKEYLNGKAEVIDFNPWMCRTPQQVVKDFFATLSLALSDKYSSLYDPIREYAKCIGSITLSSGSLLNIETKLNCGDDSLSQKKEELSSKLADLPVPVVVVIDDVDRLEKDEVFEVMRLIRNAADLKNVIYLVTFDKKYVTSILKDGSISEPSDYLEKIFSLEVHMPMIENVRLWDTFMYDIGVQEEYEGKFQQFLLLRINKDRDLILKILNTYRRVKRFTKLYMTNVNYLLKTFPNEIDIVDLFWLELLQYYDKPTYDTLKDEPDVLLYIDEARECYHIKPGVVSDVVKEAGQKYDDEKFWESRTPSILNMLFNSTLSTKSMRYLVNYDKYFALSVSADTLSYSDFKEIFKSDDCESIIEEWLKTKNLSSIVFQFTHANLGASDERNKKILLHGVMTLGLLCIRDKSNTSVAIGAIRETLKSTNIREYESSKKSREIIISWVKEKINSKRYLLELSALLNRLYMPHYQSLPEQPCDPDWSVFSNEDLENKLSSLMSSYINLHSELRATDLLCEGNGLFEIFKNCCVNVDCAPTYFECKYKQIAFGIVINHFSNVKNKPSSAEYDEAYGKLFNRKRPNRFNSQEEEDDYEDYIYESFQNKMPRVFGYNWEKDLKEFKQQCFTSES